MSSVASALDLLKSYGPGGKAYKVYRAMSPDQQAFLSTKLLKATRTPEEWLSFLREVADHDRLADAARPTAATLFYLSVVLAVLGLLVSLAVPAALLLEIVVLVGAILTGVIYFGMVRTDMPGRLRHFVVPVVAVLSQDIEPGETLTLKMDMRKPMIPGKQRGSKGIVVGVRRRSGTEDHFVDGWFSGEANLADGAKLEWRVVDFIRRRSVNKGKKGTATKYKIQTLVEARVGFPMKVYTPKAGALQEKKGSMKAGEKRNVVRIRRVFLSRDVGLAPKFDLCLDAIAAAYRHVTVNG